MESKIITPQSIKALQESVQQSQKLIPRGNGRCYGDSALGKTVISTLKLNRIFSLNQTGLLHCEAGVLLSDILDYIVPKGWFLPVTPGTKFVTVGGAIASDVHGKNHHKVGGFSNFVTQLNLINSEGNAVRCSPTENKALFYATCGGMGLTGVISDAYIQLIPIETAFIRQKTIKCNTLKEVLVAFTTHQNTTYSVAWIDCGTSKMGRSILFLGEHATHQDCGTSIQTPLSPPKRRRFTIPKIPLSILNSFFSKQLNTLYFHLNKSGEKVIDYDQFFYPLDGILHWNRLYGRKGFVQYQCVLPEATGEAGLADILAALKQHKKGAFLSVLKQLGKGNPYLSFPFPGLTLALDFPISDNPFSLLDMLDAIVNKHGGRLYLTKDARMSPEMFKKGYPEYREFQALKMKVDPKQRFESAQSIRVGLT